MTDRPATRFWQFRDWDGVWQDIVAMDATCVILGSGKGIQWDSTWLKGRLRYTVSFKGTWMAHKPGDLVLLAEDMNHPEVAEQIRAAQVEQRQQRMAANG